MGNLQEMITQNGGDKTITPCNNAKRTQKEPIVSV